MKSIDGMHQDTITMDNNNHKNVPIFMNIVSTEPTP